MWFRISPFGEDSNRIAGLVGRDGEIYWRVSDIGLLLKYKAPYLFALNIITRRGKDVLPENLLPPDAYTMKVRVATTREMKELIFTKKKSIFYKQAIILQQFLDDECVVQMPYTYASCPKRSPLLRRPLSDNEEFVLTREWIDGFVQFVIQRYSHRNHIQAMIDDASSTSSEIPSTAANQEYDEMTNRMEMAASRVERYISDPYHRDDRTGVVNVEQYDKSCGAADDGTMFSHNDRDAAGHETNDMNTNPPTNTEQMDDGDRAGENETSTTNNVTPDDFCYHYDDQKNNIESHTVPDDGNNETINRIGTSYRNTRGNNEELGAIRRMTRTVQEAFEANEAIQMQLHRVEREIHESNRIRLMELETPEIIEITLPYRSFPKRIILKDGKNKIVEYNR